MSEILASKADTQASTQAESIVHGFKKFSVNQSGGLSIPRPPDDNLGKREWKLSSLAQGDPINTSLSQNLGFNKKIKGIDLFSFVNNSNTQKSDFEDEWGEDVREFENLCTHNLSKTLKS